MMGMAQVSLMVVGCICCPVLSVVYECCDVDA